MSGSPIIQNGKLVGAVTHVMINDPTTRYGIFIENMLNAAQMPRLNTLLYLKANHRNHSGSDMFLLVSNVAYLFPLLLSFFISYLFFLLLYHNKKVDT
jgi:hypothetical protein